MNFLKTRKGAAMVTAVIILLACVLGPARSLNSLRGDILELAIRGVNGDGVGVVSDFQLCQDVAANLCTVAGRYLPDSDRDMKDLKTAARLDFTKLSGSSAVADSLLSPADRVLAKLESCPVTEQEARYLSGFRADLEDRAFAMEHDPYRAEAVEFNTGALTSFAAVLPRLLGLVRPLPC